MPELPEVETVVRDLRPCLVGRTFTSITVGRRSLRQPWQSSWNSLVRNRQIQAVERRGKWIVIDLDGPLLVIHLGMTGQLTVVSADQPVADHTHMIFDLDSSHPTRMRKRRPTPDQTLASTSVERQLRFRDVRRFGSATLFTDRDALAEHFRAKDLGPEPFTMDAIYWRNCLKGTNRNLKTFLLDQRTVAGVGNIYADESLFEARLLPTRTGKDLGRAEADRLRRAIVAVLGRAIDKRGSSIRDYIGGSGLKGAFQDEFCVYGRADEPCCRCRTPILRIVLAGRSTHYCPRCQK